jgi:hypothetical protein
MRMAASVAAACLVAGGCGTDTPGCARNLQQIGHALHEYHDNENAFPLTAISDGQGRPGLSWRVAILPYLGHRDLFDRFALDEPWDGPRNRPLLAQMPAVYACPGVSRRDPSLTTYRAFTGRGAFFEPPFDARSAPVWWTDPDGTKHYQTGPTRGMSIAHFTDGTSNTLMVVEAEEAVPWTKPEGLPFDPARPSGPRLGAGSPHRGGFNAVLVDGAVRFLPSTISTAVLRSLITRNGDEVVHWDAL